MSKELVVIAKGKELEFFTGDGLDPFLAEVKTMVENFEHDMTTQKGRDATRSFARKISTFKVKVDDSGKELVAEWKKNSKAVDESRKKSRDTLDTLRDEARKPLTDWEQIDKDRIALHQVELERLRNMVNVEAETSAAYAEALKTTKACEMGKCWEEFATDAIEAKETVIEFLERGLAATTQSEADAAELERLRKEAAAREQADRDAAIAKEATEKAEREAKEASEVKEREAKEREERLRIEKEEAEENAKRQKQYAKDQAEQAERDRIESENQAELQALAAKQREAEAVEQAKIDEAARIQAEDAAATAAYLKREASKRHTNKIKKQSAKSIEAIGFTENQAAVIVEAIADKQIINVTINY